MQDTQQVSVALTAEQIASLQAAVETGEYTSTSEAIQEALRDWQTRRELSGEDIERLRELWYEGLASGPSVEPDFENTLTRARERLANLKAARL